MSKTGRCRKAIRVGNKLNNKQMKKLMLITSLVFVTGITFAQDRAENKNVSVIFDLDGGYGAGKGVNTLAQLGSGLHFVLKNNFTVGIQGEFGFLGGLKKPDALSTYSSQSLVLGKVSPVGKNWSVYPFIGIGRYNAVETSDVPDTLLNEIAGLFNSDTERFTTFSVSSVCIPFGVKLYRSKKKFMGFYVGANGFYSFNGSYGIFGNVGLAFGGRKRAELEEPLKFKPDFGIYSGIGLIGNKSIVGFNHGIDVNFFVKRNFYGGFGAELITPLNRSKELSKIHNPVSGVSGNIKFGVKTNIFEKTSLLVGVGLNLQTLTKTTNTRVETTLVEDLTNEVLSILGQETEKEKLKEYTTEEVSNAGLLFEAMFRRQLSSSQFNLLFGSKFTISKESTYGLKIGIGYSIK